MCAGLPRVAGADQVFEGLGAFWYGDFNLTSDGQDAEQVQGAFVTANFFSALGVAPARTRVSVRRRRVRATSSRVAQPRTLAAALRRRPATGRTRDQAGRCYLHSGRCDAAGHGVSRQFAEAGVMDAAFLCGRRQDGDTRHLFSPPGRKTQAGRFHRAGGNRCQRNC